MTILSARPGFLFGADPEFFLKDTKTGLHVSAAGLIPGTKDAPHKVEGGAIQVDGMAAEFNIDPVDNFADFNSNINKVLKAMRDIVPSHLEFDFSPAVIFNEEIFDNAPDDAKILGCTPDYNAWTGDLNPPPADPDNPYLRTASGHLHIGWCQDADIGDAQHKINCEDLVKQCDWYLGAWSVKMDDDATRRRLYGKAGAYRPKPYGVEYRVLSNFWLSSRDRRVAVWNRLQLAIADMRKNFHPEKFGPDYNLMLTESINSAKVNPMLAQIARYPLQTIRL